MDQFCIQRKYGVKFNDNRITFDPSLHIKSALKIHVDAYKWPKNIGIVMKFGMDCVFCKSKHIFIIIHHTKFCSGWSIIAQPDC